VGGGAAVPRHARLRGAPLLRRVAAVRGHQGGRVPGRRHQLTKGYLTVTQALADYASFVLSLKANLSAPAAPVLVFGVSYGGMLAAWMRLKYPHVVMGAVASSAPILSFYGIVDPYAFYDRITDDFKVRTSGFVRILYRKNMNFACMDDSFSCFNNCV